MWVGYLDVFEKVRVLLDFFKRRKRLCGVGLVCVSGYLNSVASKLGHIEDKVGID